MKLLLFFASVVLIFTSCKSNEFCGTEVETSEISGLNESILEGDGAKLAMQLSIEYSTEFKYNEDTAFEVLYSSMDTIYLKIVNLPDIETAQKLSCIIDNNNIVKNNSVVYTSLEWKNESLLVKY